MSTLWGYFIGTVVGSGLGAFVAIAWYDAVFGNPNDRNRRR